jgi:hypothetical protein
MSVWVCVRAAARDPRIKAMVCDISPGYGPANSRET